MSACVKCCSNVLVYDAALRERGQFVLIEKSHIARLQPRRWISVVGLLAEKKELIKITGVFTIGVLGLVPNALKTPYPNLYVRLFGYLLGYIFRG